MRKVLFLGCNHNQIPYLEAARRLGFTIIGTDLNPAAPGASLADRFHCAGYDDVAKLVQIAEQEKFTSQDHIFTAAAHFAWEGAAQTAAAIGVPFISIDSVDICLDKVKFYQLLRSCGEILPCTEIYEESLASVPDANKVYYLKSDYGKSPYYCFRVENGHMPALPAGFDRYYRKHFVIQQEIVGTHYRVDLYGDEMAVFLKVRDDVCLPLPFIGPGHGAVREMLSIVVEQLGLTRVLTKFDIIANGEGFFVIDIGLDPPLRLKLLYDYQGLDFAEDYMRHTLLGEPALLPWHQLCRPLLIQGTPGSIQFKDLSTHA